MARVRSIAAGTCSLNQSSFCTLQEIASFTILPPFCADKSDQGVSAYLVKVGAGMRQREPREGVVHD
jgi:hypothetical protein